MIFTTVTFLIFLALVFSAYWLIGARRQQNLLIAVASYIFYGWWDWRFCFLMAASTTADFFVAQRVAAAQSAGARRSWLVATLAFNLGILGFFKYFNFFADSFVTLAEGVGWRVDSLTVNVLLPVGISFYTFQSLSYTIDVYFRRMKPIGSLIDYTAFVAFFPQLVAGPIERATHLLPQFQRRRVFEEQKAVDGCRQILWGFFKKLAIADTLAPLVDQAYADPAGASGASLALATVFFAFQIYCDFSAYSDIAIGTARLFGFELMRNFAYPYFSRSPAEFWRRWHISLSTWFRDYVYIPLGGSRKGRFRAGLNILATFTLSGLWHGAAGHFIVWGALNGLAVLPEALRARRGDNKSRADDIPGGESVAPTLKTAFAIASTFAIICFTWVFFRAASVETAWLIVTKIMRAPLENGAAEIIRFNLKPLALIALLVVIEWVQRRRAHPLQWAPPWRVVRWAGYTALLWLTFDLTPGGKTAFIYFQF